MNCRILAIVACLLPVAASHAAPDVLARVKQNGAVRCAIDMTPGFTKISANGEASGFDIDFCRAIAAATLGDSHRIAVQRISSAEKYRAVAAGDVDVAFGMASWTLTRDTALGTRFPAIIFHDGQGFMVWSDASIARPSDAKEATICVQSQTTSIDTLRSAIRRHGWSMQVAEYPTSEEKWNAFAAHKCAMVTGDRSELTARRGSMASDPNRWVLLPDIISREPLGPVIVAGDDRWFAIVRWAVLVTQIAEVREVGSANIASLTDGGDVELTRLIGRDAGFGASLGLNPLWARRIIEQVGNYGEIYERNFGANTPFALDRGQNALWSNGGLFYPPPLR